MSENTKEFIFQVIYWSVMVALLFVSVAGALRIGGVMYRTFFLA